ncbi:hypothetical protein ABK040_013476 [Willaertia magna]
MAESKSDIVDNCIKTVTVVKNNNNLDKFIIENIFYFSKIKEIIFKLQFICKTFYEIYQSEIFKRKYYCNVFNLTQKEINNLDYLLLDNFFYKNNFPQNFNELFNFWINLEINSKLKDFNLNNNLKLNKYENKLNELLKLTNNEINKTCAFYFFNKLQKTDLILKTIVNIKNKIIEDDEIIEINEKILFKKKLLQLFKISKLNYNKFYLKTCYFEKKLNKFNFHNKKNPMTSHIEYILFLDNGLPILVNNYYEFSNIPSMGPCAKHLIEINNKNIFEFKYSYVGEISIVNNKVLDLLKINLFEIDEEYLKFELFKMFRNEKLKYQDCNLFIYGFFYFLFYSVHESIRECLQLEEEITKYIATFDLLDEEDFDENNLEENTIIID